jgi:hypothetical protein
VLSVIAVGVIGLVQLRSPADDAAVGLASEADDATPIDGTTPDPTPGGAPAAGGPAAGGDPSSPPPGTGTPDDPAGDPSTPPAAPGPAPAAPGAATIGPGTPAVPVQSGATIRIGDRVQGELTEAEPVHELLFDADAGAEVVLEMVALDDGLDTVLALFDPDGQQIAENDDALDMPNSTDSRIRIVLADGGTHRIEASSFLGTTGRYELSLSTAELLRATDVLSPALPEIAYDLAGTAGQRLIITMQARDDDIDPVIIVRDPAGADIGRDDDDGGFPNARLEITLPSDGVHQVVATTFGGRFGAFELVVVQG